MDVYISKKSKKVHITLRVNFVDGKAIGLYDWSLVPKITQQQFGGQKPYLTATRSFNQLCSLAIEGINYYWSRNNTHPTGKNIVIGGSKYEVFITGELSKNHAMNEMTLTYVTNVDPNNPIVRSSNWILSRKTAYATGYLRIENQWTFYTSNLSDSKFKETIAHEIGHEIVEAYAGFKESVTHHGSSEYSQIPKTGTKYPRSGEIDLMKYAEEDLSIVSGGRIRMIANEQDVNGLLFISGISKK